MLDEAQGSLSGFDFHVSPALDSFYDWASRKQVTVATFYSSILHARPRSSTGGHVQLLIAGTAGAGGPPAPQDSRDGRRSIAEHVGAVRWHVRQDGSAVDPAGETATGAIDLDAVLGPQRASADGRDRLQHVVPVVRRHELG